jgi:hypothetical protein
MKTKCKCKCHKPQYSPKYKKTLKADICSYCMENHKRSKYYHSMKVTSELFGELFK